MLSSKQKKFEEVSDVHDRIAISVERARDHWDECAYDAAHPISPQKAAEIHSFLTRCVSNGFLDIDASGIDPTWFHEKVSFLGHDSNDSVTMQIYKRRDTGVAGMGRYKVEALTLSGTVQIRDHFRAALGDLIDQNRDIAAPERPKTLSPAPASLALAA